MEFFESVGLTEKDEKRVVPTHYYIVYVIYTSRVGWNGLKKNK